MNSDAKYTLGSLQAYEPPSWTKGLKWRPSAYAQLAMRPTPIHRWALPGVPSGFQVYVKRDDLTGSTLSGNKIRKVEFLLGDALERNCDCVVACGSTQSNHCRITAMASRQVGLEPHLLLRPTKNEAADGLGCTGNLLLDRISGAKIVLVDPQTKLVDKDTTVDGTVVKTISEQAHDYAELLRVNGRHPYVMNIGGYSREGDWGYVEAFQEMKLQGLLENFDDLVTTSTGGGTAAALAIANYLTGSKIKVHAVSIYDSGDIIYSTLEALIHDLGLAGEAGSRPLRSWARELLDIMEEHSGDGYGQSTAEELSQMVDIVSNTGVGLDPVYTLKGVRGLLAEMGKNPGRFAGKRVLFIHTGGIFNLYDGVIDQFLIQCPATNRVSNNN